MSRSWFTTQLNSIGILANNSISSSHRPGVPTVEEAAIQKAGAEPTWVNTQGMATFLQTDMVQWKKVADYAKIRLFCNKKSPNPTGVRLGPIRSKERSEHLQMLVDQQLVLGAGLLPHVVRPTRCRGGARLAPAFGMAQQQVVVVAAVHLQHGVI